MSSYRVLDLPVQAVFASGKNVREIPEDDALVELSASIQRDGLLQCIGVRAQDDGRYRLVWGERRLRAHLRLRLTKISAHVYPDNGTPDEVLMALENLHRQQLTLREECAQVNALANGLKMSTDEIVTALNRSRSWVLQRLMVPNLPEDLRRPLLDGELKLGAVEQIALLENEALRNLCVNQAINGRMTVGQVKQLVHVHLNNPAIGEAQAWGDAVASGKVTIPTVLMTCESCGATREVTQFRLVRVCANGCRSEPDPIGADQADLASTGNSNRE